MLMQAYIEKEDSKKLKQKQRERMQPKMGKMDIDYQVLSSFQLMEFSPSFVILYLTFLSVLTTIFFLFIGTS